MSPSRLSDKSFHLVQCSFSLVTMGWRLRRLKSWRSLVTIIPRYLNSSTHSSGVDGGAARAWGSIGKITDLDQLILTPENLPNWSKISRAVCKEVSASCKYSNASSAYKEIFSCRGPTLSPCTPRDSRIRIANGSRANANKLGDLFLILGLHNKGQT